MKKFLFFSGIACGVILTNHWRSLAKEGIKVGIQTGNKLTELSQKAKEELEDVAAEIEAELRNDQGPVAGTGTANPLQEAAVAN